MNHEEIPDAKARLAAMLGHEPEPSTWFLLEETGWVTDDAGGSGPNPADLLAEYHRLAWLSPQFWRRTFPPDQTLQARGLLIAHRAAELPVVRRFRANHMNGESIETNAVADWLQRNGKPSPSLHVADALAGRPSRFIYVPYRLPGRDTDDVFAVDPRSLSSQLKAVAESLSKWTPWSVGEGVTFVLTAVAPSISLAWGSADANDGPLGSWGRVRLDLDPGASPAVVLELYRQLRDRLGATRHRRAKRPPAVLLAFVDELNDQQWPEIFEAWNARYPDWAYSQVANMQRDHARARRRAE